MRIEKVKNVIYKIMLFILFILVMYVTYCSIFNIYQPNIEMKPIIIILGIITLIFVFIKLKSLICKVNEKKSNLFAIGICGIFFIGLLFFGIKMSILPYDELFNREAIEMIKNSGQFVSIEHFERYSNEIPITLFIYFIYSLGNILNIRNLQIFITIINCIFIVVTAFFTYLSVKKIKDYKLALITLIFFIINPIFYLYASYLSIYTVCMPFIAISIYLFILAIKSNCNKVSITSMIFSGVILAIGFKITIYIIIMLIAMIVAIILNNKFGKKLILKTVSLVLGFIIGISIFSLSMSLFNIPNDINKKIPITFWIKLSLNNKTDGGYDKNDFEETCKETTYSKKIESDLEIIKDRLFDLGIKEWITLSKIKLARMWSNGDYNYENKLSHVDEVNNMYEYISGNRRIFLIYYCQILKATMLFVFLVAVAKELGKREKEKLHSVLYISVFGAFLFYMMWEVLSRYSLTFLPWLMLVFGIGITQLENLINANKIEFEFNKGKIKNLCTDKIRKAILISTITCTIFLLIINFYTYAGEKKDYWDVRVLQDAISSEKIEKVSNRKIEQTFKTSKKFNSIAIAFHKDNIKTVTHYKFILYNSKRKVIYQKDFSSNSVLSDRYKTFSFKDIKPKGEEEYIIQICSTDAKDDNSIYVSTSWQDNWVPYPQGRLTVNGKPIDGSASFKVQNKVNRTYTSKKVYIVMSIIIITLQLFAFYPYLKNNRKRLQKNKI